jgi:hypothetical protein
MPEPKQVNPTKKFYLGEFDTEIFNSLSEWDQNIIKKSPEYKLIARQARQCHDLDINISFKFWGNNSSRTIQGALTIVIMHGLNTIMFVRMNVYR